VLSEANDTETVCEGSTNLRAAVFCRGDLDINPMTLKLEGDLDTLNKYTHTTATDSPTMTPVFAV